MHFCQCLMIVWPYWRSVLVQTGGWFVSYLPSGDCAAGVMIYTFRSPTPILSIVIQLGTDGQEVSHVSKHTSWKCVRSCVAWRLTYV